MSKITSNFARFIKVLGIMAVVAAFAAAAFPAHTFASSMRTSPVANYGKVVITVYNASTPTATAKPVVVQGAVVEILTANGVSVSKATTDANGQVGLALAEGTYKVRVSASGFNSAGAYFDIKNGTTQSVSVKLSRSSIGASDR